MIAEVELAIVERLSLGMGQMTRQVSSYGGEMDGDMAEVVRQLPGAWVTFGGITDSKPTSLTRRRSRVTGRFVVLVGERSVRSEAASRMGGPVHQEVGSYRMVEAVRRLLAGQDLGLKISGLVPGKVKTLFNTQLEKLALSVFACEFDADWLEDALEPGEFPLRGAVGTHPDTPFQPYRGRLSEPPPDWLRTRLSYDLNGSQNAAEDSVEHEPDKS